MRSYGCDCDAACCYQSKAPLIKSLLIALPYHFHQLLLSTHNTYFHHCLRLSKTVSASLFLLDKPICPSAHDLQISMWFRSSKTSATIMVVGQQQQQPLGFRIKINKYTNTITRSSCNKSKSCFRSRTTTSTRSSCVGAVLGALALALALGAGSCTTRCRSCRL